MADGRAVQDLGWVPTPEPLARWLAQRLGPTDAALDPACGEGVLLAAVAGTPSGVRPRLFGIELDPARARRALERLTRLAPPGGPLVRCADALAEACDWPDADVIANPPWISHAGRHARPRGTTAAGAREGWPSTHGAFLERIARHVGQHGRRAAVLLPRSVAALERYAPLRRRVGRWAVPEQPVELLAEDAIPGVLEPAAVLVLVPRRAPAEEPDGASWLAPTEVAAAWDAALAAHPRLPPHAFADPGVHTGNCARELVRPWEEEHHPPLRQGRDLTPFSLGPARVRLRDDLRPSEGRRFRIPSRAHLAAFPALVRQTADRPVAALHHEPGYFRNSLLGVRAVDGLDPAFVVAVLNSGFAASWHREHHVDARQDTFPQVKVRHLRGLPFPLAQRSEDPRLHDALVSAGNATERIDHLLADAFGLSSELREACARISCRTGS